MEDAGPRGEELTAGAVMVLLDNRETFKKQSNLRDLICVSSKPCPYCASSLIVLDSETRDISWTNKALLVMRHRKIQVALHLQYRSQIMQRVGNVRVIRIIAVNPSLERNQRSTLFPLQ